MFKTVKQKVSWAAGLAGTAGAAIGANWDEILVFVQYVKTLI